MLAISTSHVLFPHLPLPLCTQSPAATTSSPGVATPVAAIVVPILIVILLLAGVAVVIAVVIVFMYVRPLGTYTATVLRTT